MDLARGAVADRYSLTKDAHGDGLAQVASGAGSLWVTRHLAGELLRVDPVTGRVQKRIRGLRSPYAVAFGDGAAWVVIVRRVARIDAATNTVTRVEPAGRRSPARRRRRLCLGLERGERHGLQDRPARADRRHLRDGRRSRDISYSDGTLWVVNQDGAPSPASTRRPGRSEHFVSAIRSHSVAALHGKLLVELNRGPHLRRPNRRAQGKVARLVTPIYEFDHPDPAISGNGYAHSFIFQAERATCAPLLGYPDAPPPRGQRPRAGGRRRDAGALARPAHLHVHGAERLPLRAALERTARRGDLPLLDRARALAQARAAGAPGSGLLGDLEGARLPRRSRGARLRHPRPRASGSRSR